MPKLAGIDHVHVYVGDRDEALRWYFEVLGFRPLEEFSAWATKNGPLTLGDATGSVHLALFERKGVPPTSTIAFGANGASFLEWKIHFEEHGLELRLTDHTLAYSLYFSDPWDNAHEITTLERDYVAERLG